MNKTVSDKNVSKWGDMLPLVNRVKEFLDDKRGARHIFDSPIPTGDLSERFGFTGKGGKPEVVLAEDTAVEIGHPSLPSAAILLLTREKGIVSNGLVNVVGPDIPGADSDAKLPFAQVVMLEINEDTEPDPFEMGNLQYLMHRLPGYMTRSVPGRLWVRVSRSAVGKGMSFHAAGSALIHSYLREAKGVSGAEVLFVTSSAADVNELNVVAKEAEILMGRHRKLAIAPDGEIECSDLNCDDCDEKPVCDDLRDIVIKRRKMRSKD